MGTLGKRNIWMAEHDFLKQNIGWRSMIGQQNGSVLNDDSAAAVVQWRSGPAAPRRSQEPSEAPPAGQDELWLDRTRVLEVIPNTESSRKFPVRLFVAYMRIRPSEIWRGHVTQRTGQNLVLAGFPSFTQAFPGFPVSSDFAGPRATADRQCAPNDAFVFPHKNAPSPHNRFSTHFFSMKIAEFWKMVLVSSIIDFDDIQFWLRQFCLNLNTFKVTAVFLIFLGQNMKKIVVTLQILTFKQNWLSQSWISSKSIMQLTKTIF